LKKKGDQKKSAETRWKVKGVGVTVDKEYLEGGRRGHFWKGGPRNIKGREKNGSPIYRT